MKILNGYRIDLYKLRQTSMLLDNPFLYSSPQTLGASWRKRGSSNRGWVLLSQFYNSETYQFSKNFILIRLSLDVWDAS